MEQTRERGKDGKFLSTGKRLFMPALNKRPRQEPTQPSMADVMLGHLKAGTFKKPLSKGR